MQRAFGKAFVPLRFPEPRKNVIPSPTVGALGGPAIVIRRRAAHVDKGVDRARASDQLAAGPDQSATKTARLRNRVVAPIDLAVDQADPTPRHPRRDRRLADARFK